MSVVRREQIRVLIKTAPLPGHPRCGRPLVGGYAQTAALTAAQGAAKTAAELAEIDRGACTAEDGERALVRGVNAADGEAGEVPAAVE